MTTTIADEVAGALPPNPHQDNIFEPHRVEILKIAPAFFSCIKKPSAPKIQ